MTPSPRLQALLPAALLLAAAWLSAAAPAAAAGERLTPERLWQLGRVSAPRPSPDGQWLLFEVTKADVEKNANDADVHVLRLADGTLRRLTTHEKSDSDALWLPDGRVAFVSARDGKPQAYAIRVDGGEAVRLTDEKEGIGNLRASPDGRFLSFTTRVQLDETMAQRHEDLQKTSARVYDDLLFRHWDEWRDGTYSHLMIRAQDGGETHDVMKDERVHTPLPPFGDRAEIAWAPDGTELCYTAKKVDVPAASTDSDLYVVSIVDGKPGETKNLTEGMDGFDRYPSYSPDGKWIAFLSMARAGFEADQERILLIDRASGAIRRLAEDKDVSFGGLAWAPDSSCLYAEAAVRGTVQAFRVGLDGKTTQVTSGRHDLHGLAVSADGASLFAQRSTMERPAELVRFSASAERTSELETLTHVNDEAIAALEPPLVEERVVKTQDGQELFCWVIKPPGFDPAKKYPLLTYCQGGPQSPVSQFFSFRWNFHLMAANGYVVVAPNRRGVPGFGQAWTDAVSRDWGGKAMQDYLDATDSMFEEPWIDRERAAAVGASFGGYSVYWLMGHDEEDRFCAMVAHCGMFNTYSWYAATEELWFADWDVGEPWWTSDAARAAFDASSPHLHVGKWDTPLLVIHGELDYRVPVGEGIQAFQAAQRRGVPSRFLYFPDEGHWVNRPQNSLVWHREFFAWLDQWCKPR